MSEKAEQRQPVDETGGPKTGTGKTPQAKGREKARNETPDKGDATGSAKAGLKTREDRLADALRANLRRRKNAAKARDSE